MDILETVSYIHIVYQTVCLSPYLIDRKGWTLKASRLLEIYSLFTITASLLFMLFGIFGEENFTKISDNDLGQTVHFIQIVGIRVAYMASIFEALVRRKDQNKFYWEVKQIDRIIESYLNTDVNNKKFRYTTMLFGSAMAFVYFAAEIFILISKLVSHEQNFILFSFLYLMPFLICGLRYFQVFTSMSILSHRFGLLVNVLDQISRETHTYEMENVDLMGNTETPLDRKYSLPFLDSFSFKNRCSDIENFQLKKLLLVRDAYNRLFFLSEILNRYFGISMLINVGNDFISVISNLYWIFYNFHDFYPTRDNILLIACISARSLPHLVNVAVLAILCNRTVQRSNQIGINLHRINTDISNDNYNTLMAQFSLQLLHQKVSITAAGFFSIDCTLLYTIVGATTTYLIILIQFHMSGTKLTHGHKH